MPQRHLRPIYTGTSDWATSVPSLGVYWQSRTFRGEPSVYRDRSLPD
jgi:hypothetical protein